MNKLTTIVPNSRPAYVAEACTNEKNEIVEVSLSPIVAWRIEYESELNSENSSAIPITTDIGLPTNYAIYYSDTEQWNVPFETWGSGLSDLLAHFQLKGNA